MVYKTLWSTGRHISQFDENDELTDFHSTDLIENQDCETCQDCVGQGCDLCDFLGYIDFSEPNGVN